VRGQRGVSLSIAFNIAGDLRLPVGAVRTRHLKVLRAAMPETPIDKDRHAGTREDHIGSDSETSNLQSQVLSKPKTRTV
jgi:hypothetical protein